MAHVHLLGDVGAGEIDDDGFGWGNEPGLATGLPLGRSTVKGCGSPRQRNPEPWIGQPGGHLSGQGLGPQAQVEETRAGDLRLQTEGGEGGIGLQTGRDLLSDGTGLQPQRLGQGQGPIGLEVAEFGLAGGD